MSIFFSFFSVPLVFFFFLSSGFVGFRSTGVVFFLSGVYGSGLVCCCLCQGGVFWFGLGRFSPATLRIQLEKTRESWGLSFCPWCEIFGSVISERNCFTYFSPLNENGGFFFTGIVNFTKILFAPGLSYGNG